MPQESNHVPSPEPSKPERTQSAHAAAPLVSPHGEIPANESSIAIGKRTHHYTSIMYSWTYAVMFSIIAIVGFITIPLIPFAFAGGWILGHMLWKNFWYFIDETEIRTEHRLFGQRSRRVPFDRVEGADIRQPMSLRRKGLAELRIESAGGPNSGIKIACIPMEEAQYLRALVLERSHALRAKTNVPADSGSEGHVSIQSPLQGLGNVADISAPIENTYDDERELLGKASNTEIVIGNALSNWTLGGFTSVFAALPIAILLGVLGLSNGDGFSSWLTFAGSLLLFGAIVVPLYSINYWNFELTRGKQGLSITYGLFNRVSNTIPLDRIQGVRLSQPLLWRIFGRCKVILDVAGYESGGESEDLEIRLWPIGKLDFAYALINQVLVEPNPDQHELNATRGSVRGALFAPIAWRFAWLTRSSNTVRSIAGWATQTVQIAGQNKVQSVQVSQGPLQRVLGLASISVHVPDGPISISLNNFNAEEAMPLLLAEVNDIRAASESERTSTNPPSVSGNRT